CRDSSQLFPNRWESRRDSWPSPNCWESVERWQLSTFACDFGAPWLYDCNAKGAEGLAYRENHALQARALSIISSQMPLDLRMTSTSSRAAPLPPSALVVLWAASRTSVWSLWT